ncbi:DUF1622 domain-containing protein [Variovorax sp. J22P168]|uniref:DUF1622 domain-containing protein n=1 Tax=Variovorax jilinensis TaxID=3053513 RepID=UPI0025786474|nr:DUF1622 domain-containing protein [Variovorax sp. J22P168]MDM0014060.1 DUF1622 domain-containing protein [Variovorax sp. J22P168]
METALHLLAERLSQTLQFITMLLLAFGTAAALWNLLRGLLAGRTAASVTLEVWQGLSRWLLLGLEFMLAADLIDTAVSPNWDDIGKLGAIAAIRTLLGYFLGRDIELARRITQESEQPPSPSKDA